MMANSQTSTVEMRRVAGGLLLQPEQGEAPGLDADEDVCSRRTIMRPMRRMMATVTRSGIESTMLTSTLETSWRTPTQRLAPGLGVGELRQDVGEPEIGEEQTGRPGANWARRRVISATVADLPRRAPAAAFGGRGETRLRPALEPQERPDCQHEQQGGHGREAQAAQSSGRLRWATRAASTSASFCSVFFPRLGERFRGLGVDVLLEDVEHLPRPDEYHQPLERADARRDRLRRLGELLVGDVLDALGGALHAFGGGRLADARPQGDDRPVPDDQLHRMTGGDGRVSRLVRLRRRRRGGG